MMRRAVSRLAFGLSGFVFVGSIHLLLTDLIVTNSSYAQVTSPITASGLGTTVISEGMVHTITGGTRPGNGLNLFHSFGEFSVPPNNIANFFNDTALPTSNILSRVTDGNPSNVFGTIQTTGFGNANLFLMNPAGILFGPNATLNVGGAVHFTTADYLRLTDGILFNAVPDAAADALLSAAPVAAFGFLGSNPGAITIQGSQLSVPSGQGISLVGGNMEIQAGTLDDGTVQPARLSAPGGQINVASATSPGEFLLASLEAEPNVNGESFSSFGTVNLAQGSTIDVSQSGNGRVSISGGQFVLDVNQAVLSTTTTSTAGGPDRVTLSRGSLIRTQTVGPDPGSDIQIMASAVQMDGARIQSFTFGEGPGGGISIGSQDAQSLNLSNGSTIESRAEGLGPGGAININVSSVNIDGASIGSSVSPFDFVVEETLGPALTFNVDNLNIRGGGFVFAESMNLFGEGPPIVSGTITINATDTVTISGTSPDGRMSRIESRTDSGAVGDIAINTRNLLVTEGARINSAEFLGQAGRILVTATESVTVADGAKIRMDTSLLGGGLVDISSPNIVIDQGIIQTLTVGEGDAAAVKLRGNNVTLSGGQINSQTVEGLGRGGDVTIDVTNKLSITGQFAGNPIDPSGPAGIFTTTDLLGAAGGDIRITAGQSVALENGSRITASSTGEGNAGNITINAGTQLLMTDSSITTQAAQAGGGNIAVKAGDMVRLINSQINTSVAGGTGGGGDITIDPNFVILQNSQILAQAFAGQGGNINITTGVFLADASSLVDASSQFGLSGTVTIQSPTSNLSSVWARLQQNYVDVAALVRARCAAQVSGQYSSFVQTGRDAIPLEPGGWLLSPMALSAGEGPRAQDEGNVGPETELVSLRGFDQNLSWPGLGQMPRRFVSILDSACGS